MTRQFYLLVSRVHCKKSGLMDWDVIKHRFERSYVIGYLQGVERNIKT